MPIVLKIVCSLERSVNKKLFVSLLAFDIPRVNINLLPVLLFPTTNFVSDKYTPKRDQYLYFILSLDYFKFLLLIDIHCKVLRLRTRKCSNFLDVLAYNL